ncbi:MAG: sigma-E processing peptidase SpoIIGA, partial [Oscillospiraceae bacterium]|nr:sigma-E processing peptidase SpoIIGA [Oscillospiraceae bacterium]
MTVYVDVLLLINTLVNYFMLLGVKIITGAETKRYRLILGALTGGLSALSVFLNMDVIVTVLKFFTAALMVRISFPFISAKVYLKKCIWLFIISAVFSGVCLAVYLLFDTDLMIYSNGTVYF